MAYWSPWPIGTGDDAFEGMPALRVRLAAVAVAGMTLAANIASVLACVLALARCATGQEAIEVPTEIIRSGSLTTLWAVDAVGTRLVAVGDVNEDGITDLASACEFIDSGPEHEAQAHGQVTLYSGKTGQTLWTRAGEGWRDELGASLAVIGDVNGDRALDLAVGATQSGKANRRYREGHPDDLGVEVRWPGYVLILSGRDGRIVRRLEGSHPGSEFGFSVAAVGDLDGGALGDLLVGAPRDGTAGSDAGKVCVYSVESGDLLRVIAGPFPGAGFGYCVGGLPDINADRWPDFAVIRGCEPPKPGGCVELRSGRDGTLLQRLEDEPAPQRIARVSDADGDGRDDILLESLVDANSVGGNRGKVSFLSATERQVLRVFEEAPYKPGSGPGGVSHQGRLGDLEVVTGDIDGDGRMDVVLGCGSGFMDPATLTAFSGKDGSELLYLNDEASRGMLLSAIAALGDFDGDGRDDLVLGLRGASRHEPRLVAVRISQAPGH